MSRHLQENPEKCVDNPATLTHQDVLPRELPTVNEEVDRYLPLREYSDQQMNVSKQESSFQPWPDDSQSLMEEPNPDGSVSFQPWPDDSQSLMEEPNPDMSVSFQARPDDSQSLVEEPNPGTSVSFLQEEEHDPWLDETFLD